MIHIRNDTFYQIESEIENAIEQEYKCGATPITQDLYFKMVMFAAELLEDKYGILLPFYLSFDEIMLPCVYIDDNVPSIPEEFMER